MKEPMSDKNPMWEPHDIEMDDMTDDIRVGIARGLSHTDNLEWETEADKKYYLLEADRIINYLKSKNVVRLADNQDLPEFLESDFQDGKVYLNPFTYDQAQKDMKGAGWRNVRHLDGTEL